MYSCIQKLKLTCPVLLTIICKYKYKLLYWERTKQVKNIKSKNSIVYNRCGLRP